MQLPIASPDKRYTCGSGRDMRSSNLPTTGLIAVVFIMLPNNRFWWTHIRHNGLSITLTGNTGKQSKCTKIPVVKNISLMRNKGHVFGVRTFTDSKNTLLGTCPEIKGTLNRCLFRNKRV